MGSNELTFAESRSPRGGRGTVLDPSGPSDPAGLASAAGDRASIRSPAAPVPSHRERDRSYGASGPIRLESRADVSFGVAPGSREGGLAFALALPGQQREKTRRRSAELMV